MVDVSTSLRRSIPTSESIIIGLLCLVGFWIVLDAAGVDLYEWVRSDVSWSVLWFVLWSGFSSLVEWLRDELETVLEERNRDRRPETE